MSDSGAAKQILADFLDLLKSPGGLRLEYEISQTQSTSSDSAASSLQVILSGADTPLLLDRNGELLHAIESLGVAVLRLTPEQNDQLSIDAGGFKAERLRSLTEAAERAVASVRSTHQPFAFQPMNSRERRLLHLALVPSGLATASSGLGPRRFVVLYPEGQVPPPEPAAPERSYSRPQRAGSRDPRATPHGARYVRPAPYVPSSQRPASTSLGPQEEQIGNRLDQDFSSALDGEDAAATEARLESIRRAFRKR